MYIYLYNVDVEFLTWFQNQQTLNQKPSNQLPRYVEPEAIRIVRHLCFWWENDPHSRDVFLNHPELLMWKIRIYACACV